MKKLLIIDDFEIIRDGVKRILDEPPGTTVFGEASTVPDALRMVQQEDWDALILDVTIGGQSGLDLLRELKQIRPNLPVVILSMHLEEQYVRRAFKAGASGYVTKGSSRQELTSAVSRVMQGGRYISSEMAERLVLGLQHDTETPPHGLLSDREFEVLRMIGGGKSIREIADLLALSDKTISTYRARILEKLNLRTTADVIRYVIQNHLAD